MSICLLFALFINCWVKFFYIPIVLLFCKAHCVVFNDCRPSCNPSDSKILKIGIVEFLQFVFVKVSAVGQLVSGGIERGIK